MSDLKTKQQTKCQSLGQLAFSILTRLEADTAPLERKNVAEKQAKLEQTLAELIELVITCQQHIIIMLYIFEFELECETTKNRLNKERLEADSQEFGRDLEHAELLFTKFSAFMERLSTNAEQIQRIETMAQSIFQNKFTSAAQTIKVTESCSLVTGMWKELNLQAGKRRKTLECAIQVS